MGVLPRPDQAGPLSSSPTQDTQALEQELAQCNGASSKVVAFVSKMISMDAKDLPDIKLPLRTQEDLKRRHEEVVARRRQLADEAAALRAASGGEDGSDTLPAAAAVASQPAGQEAEAEAPPARVMVAFARIFSGTLVAGTEIEVLGPKYTQPAT